MIKWMSLAAAAVLFAQPTGASAGELRISTSGKSAAQVHSEVVEAASKVCRAATRGDLLAHYVYDACLRRTVRASVVKIGDVELAAYHAQQLASR